MGCKVYDLIEADKMLFQIGYCEVPDLWRRNERNILPQTYVVAESSHIKASIRCSTIFLMLL